MKQGHVLLLFAGRLKKKAHFFGYNSTVWKISVAVYLLCYAGTVQAGVIPADSMRYVDQLNRQAILFQQKELDSAFHYATQAREIATRLDYTKGKADAWHVLGNYYGLNTNNYLCIRYYIDALQAYKKLNDSSGIGQLYARISAYYQQSGQHPSAVHYVNKAMDIGRRLRNDSMYAIILSQYADVNMEDASKQDSVQWALATARPVFNRYHDKPALFQLELLNTRRLLLEKDTAAAREKLHTLLTTASADGYHYPAMNAARLMAATSAGMHQADSIQYLAQMIASSVKGGYRSLMLPYAIQLYDWYTKQGKPDTAAYYSGVLLDILQKRTAVKSDGEMDYISFYTQQHDIHSLKLKRAIQEKILSKQQLEGRIRLFLVGFLSILLVLATLTGIYFFRAFRKTKKNAILLASKNREINEKNILLREHDDFKNKLVSVVAHDFRSPLSNIINIAVFLKEEVLMPEEANEWMMEVERTAGYTLQIFDNIQAWISSQSSGFVYTPEPCTPADMIPEVLQYLEKMISSKQLQIVVDTGSSTVWANREMLQFVHRNLIHNAIKFSPEKGVIHITAHTDHDSMTLSIADNGPGIQEDILPHLFEYSNKKENSGGHEGAGLALIICRDFIDKMNGQLKAGNLPEGGAIFSYSLPLAKPNQLQ
ncbi:Histidine kinase-, DNA gyrase B-, and HSP90-like ATPase [Chitinophaga ginsengisegetis]|uniref:histidine kinase n=1 Tax=Chitinophaga ginsengisegetis TaxID=393003 RepID=A0A1T5PAL6_9BACT|nr:tetratricopeptide repeat-containing sensor histidine kinase [Chitinophaga ginsengisegetis]SKD09775.1 Histidine kinase-, DNA gyrase B-, and HSP90-like ATPase [Chitinophaga ginsengisegetis]